MCLVPPNVFGAVLLSSRPGLGLEDLRGHLMKAVALALALKNFHVLSLGLALALRKNSGLGLGLIN